jgi:hypothetical protein
VVFDESAHYIAVGRQGSDSGVFVLTHEAAVTHYISAEYGGEFALKASLSHCKLSFSKGFKAKMAGEI